MSKPIKPGEQFPEMGRPDPCCDYNGPDPCADFGPCPPISKPCAPPDMPKYCPNPQPPCPPVPPAPSVVRGMDLYEAMNDLSQRVNTCICTYNDVMRNCYATLRNLNRAAEENGAYYGPCEVWTEQGYDAESSSKYTIIHKAHVDRNGEPIRIGLHLAYSNTTNSKIEQSLNSASMVELADKMVVAQPMGVNGWYGKTIWNGAPIPSDEQATLYTVGFTRHGIMKVYSNGACTDQLICDGIVDSMGVSGVLIQNGQVTEDSWRENIPSADVQASRVCIGQNMNSKEVIILTVGADAPNKGMTSKRCAEIMLNYGVSVAVELCEGASAGATDKGQLTFVPDSGDYPNAYAFWYISRRCRFRNDYQRELAELYQRYAYNMWQTYLNYLKIVKLRQDLDKEIQDRIDADEVLQGQINDEIKHREEADAELQRQILEEVQNRVNADAELQRQILEEVTNRVNADEVLQNQILEEVQNRVNADEVLQNQIDEERQARIDADASLQKQIDDNTANLQGQITEEITNRVNADKVLQDQIDAEIQNRKDADQSLQNQILAEVQNRVDADAALQNQILVEQQARINADIELQNQINKEIQDRVQAINDLRTELSADIDALGTRVTAIEGRLDGIDEKINALTEQMASLDATVTTLFNTIADIETSLNNLKETVTKIISGEIELPYVKIIGDTMTGDLNMQNSNITVSRDTKNTEINGATVEATDGTNIVSVGEVEGSNSETVYGINSSGDLSLVTGGDVVVKNPSGTEVTVTNVADPVDPTDAVNKRSLDEAIAGVQVGTDFVRKAGDTMTGNLVMDDVGITLQNGEQSVTITADASGNLNVGKKVSGVTAGSEDTDAVNLKQLEDTAGELGQQITNIQGDVSNIKNDITEIEGDITTINGTMAGLDDKYVNVTGDTMTGNLKFTNANVEINGNTISSDTAGILLKDGENADINISGVKDPVDDNDAATKHYVDQAVAGIPPTPTDNFVKKTGDTMSGDLNMNSADVVFQSGDNDFKVGADSDGLMVQNQAGADITITGVASPVNDNDAVPKKYVDNAIAGVQPTGDYVLKTGDTMTGGLTIDGNTAFLKYNSKQANSYSTSIDNSGIKVQQGEETELIASPQVSVTPTGIGINVPANSELSRQSYNFAYQESSTSDDFSSTRYGPTLAISVNDENVTPTLALRASGNAKAVIIAGVADPEDENDAVNLALIRSLVTPSFSALASYTVDGGSIGAYFYYNAFMIFMQCTVNGNPTGAINGEVPEELKTYYKKIFSNNVTFYKISDLINNKSMAAVTTGTIHSNGDIYIRDYPKDVAAFDMMFLVCRNG